MPKTERLSWAEIQRRYRQRKKLQDPEHYLAKERARWLKRRADKKVKVIADCSTREQRSIRKDWRKRAVRSKLRKRNATASSPPASNQRTRGRKKKKKENSKSYQTIVKLKALLALEQRAKNGIKSVCSVLITLLLSIQNLTLSLEQC